MLERSCHIRDTTERPPRDRDPNEFAKRIIDFAIDDADDSNSREKLQIHQVYQFEFSQLACRRPLLLFRMPTDDLLRPYQLFTRIEHLLHGRDNDPQGDAAGDDRIKDAVPCRDDQ